MIRTPHAKRPSRLARKRRYSYQPQIDTLEQRAMLAADLQFTPLVASADTAATGNVGTPTVFDLATEFTQTVVQRRGNAVGSDPDLGANLGQNTINESGPFLGRYLFSAAAENGIDSQGFTVGTLNRTDLATGQTINLLDIAVSDLQFPDDPTSTLGSVLTMQNLHAVRWTPWGTLLVAEAIENTADTIPDLDDPLTPEDESLADLGLVYEIVDPTSDQPRVFTRAALGSANFGGIDFDALGNVYYTDNNGADSTIFRFVPDGFGIDSPLESGIVYVLDTAAPTGDATWEEVPLFSPSLRTALTDPSVNFTIFNIARDVEVGFADFGEDAESDETLFVAIQGSHQVIALDLDGPLVNTDAPFLYNFVDSSVDPDFNDPVDLSIDASGRLYIGEAINPPPGANQVAAGNDVWVASDAADDIDDDVDAPTGLPVIDPVGSTDQLGRLASLRVSNSSVYGLYVNPFNNNQIYVNSSSATPAKNAVVRFDFAGVLEPSVTEVDLGNGEIALVIVGTQKSESIIVSGSNLLNVRIGLQNFRGLAPSNSVLIYGLGGNDYIVANSGTFYDFNVFGGAGNDYIATGRGNDVLAGEAGNDRLLSGTGNNVLSGGLGDDSLSAGNGDDVLSGDAGNDRLVSNGGNDTLLGGDGNDSLVGGLDNDYVNGGAGNDKVDGGFGDDIVLGGLGNDQVRGGSGTNVIIGGDGTDLVYGGSGDDLLIGDFTAVDDDDDGLIALAQLWQMVFFSPDAGQEVYDFLASYDDLGVGVTNDNKRDYLDGGAGLDWFFRFGTSDTIRIINPGDEVFDLNNV